MKLFQSRLYRGFRELFFCCLELTIIYMAVYLNMEWAGNILKAWSVFVFLAGGLCGLICIISSVGNVKSDKKMETVLPRWVHHLSDAIGILILLANAWWWTGTFLLVGYLFLKLGIFMFNKNCVKEEPEIYPILGGHF